MARGLLITLLLATATLYASANYGWDSTPSTPVCDYKPPCPKGKGTVWYCRSGKAYNGCSVGKPFPSKDCYDQCTYDGSKGYEWGGKEVEWASSDWETPKKDDWEAPKKDDWEAPKKDDWEAPKKDDWETPTPAPVCPYKPPCPKGKGTVWYCKSGKAYNGCSVGKPFPSKECYDQCTDDGSKGYEWGGKKEVEWASSGWETPSWTPEPAPVCDYKPPCPKGKGTVWYCLSGKAYKGCSVGKPFPSKDCYEQCTDDGSKGYEWGGKKEVEWASSGWETPSWTPEPAPVCDYKPPCPKGKGTVWYCLSGKAYDGCSVGKPFPSKDCYEQCTDDGSKAYEWY